MHAAYSIVRTASTKHIFIFRLYGGSYCRLLLCANCGYKLLINFKFQYSGEVQKFYLTSWRVAAVGFCYALIAGINY